MKLNRLKLIEVARSGLEKSKSNHVTWVANVDAAEAAWEKRWREHTLPQWRGLRDLITKALKSGAHITADDLPFRLTRYMDEEAQTAIYRPFRRGHFKGGYVSNGKHNQGTWTSDHAYGPPPTVETQAFEQLADFLEAVEDESVTSGQLENAGFRNMAKLWTAAAQGYWT